MRYAAASAIVLAKSNLTMGSLIAGLAGLLAVTTSAQAEHFCSPGFEPSYNGQCIATMARDEIQLYLNEPAYDAAPRVIRHHRHHRVGLRERY